MQRYTTKKPFYILILLFLLPIIMGEILFYSSSFFHFKTTNRGTLVSPAIPLAQFNPSINKQMKRQWHVIYTVSAQTPKTRETVALLLRIPVALGENYKRVQVAEQPEPLNSLAALSSIITNLDQKIYLVDPLGNVLMYYSLDTSNPMDVLKDLKHLLQVSQIG